MKFNLTINCAIFRPPCIKLRETVKRAPETTFGNSHEMVSSSFFHIFTLSGIIRVFRLWFFYGATACNLTHGIAKAFLSVRPSVCLSVERVHCDKTKETCAHILTPYERKFILVFRHEEWLVGELRPLYLKFWVKLTPLEQKRLFSIAVRS